MKKITLLGCLIFLFFSQTALATWDVSGPINFLEASAEVRVKVGPMNINPGSCVHMVEYALLSSQENYNAIYSLLLGAKIAGVQVSLDLNGCTPSGFNRVVGARFSG